MRIIVVVAALTVSISFFKSDFPAQFLHKAGSNVQAQQPQNGDGQIEGRILTSDGNPINQAKVYAVLKLEGPVIRRHPLTFTDENGRFVLPRLAAGEYAIHAFKESEGYPNLTFNFYAAAYGGQSLPTVIVRSGKISRGVTIKLGPKAGRLVIKVTDAISGLPIENAEVALNHQGKPLTLFKSGATERGGVFRLLAPSSVNINLEVTAKGYRSWRYLRTEKNRQIDTLQVSPGTDLEIMVTLQPTKVTSK